MVNEMAWLDDDKIIVLLSNVYPDVVKPSYGNRASRPFDAFWRLNKKRRIQNAINVRIKLSGIYFHCLLLHGFCAQMREGSYLM